MVQLLCSAYLCNGIYSRHVSNFAYPGCGAQNSPSPPFFFLFPHRGTHKTHKGPFYPHRGGHKTRPLHSFLSTPRRAQNSQSPFSPFRVHVKICVSANYIYTVCLEGTRQLRTPQVEHAESTRNTVLYDAKMSI